MAFPLQAYDQAIMELRATIADRDTKGRNETNDFYSQFPHGISDLTFELYRRVQRILGAETKGDLPTVYGDTLDLANYALFLMMLLKKYALDNVPATPPPADTREPNSIGPVPRNGHIRIGYGFPDQSWTLAGPSDTADSCSHL